MGSEIYSLLISILRSKRAAKRLRLVPDMRGGYEGLAGAICGYLPNAIEIL